MRGEPLACWCCVLAVLLPLAGPAIAQEDEAPEPPDPATVAKEYRELRGAAEALRKGKRYPEAVAVCEEFLRRYPDVGQATRGVVVLIDDIVGRDMRDAVQRREVWLRAISDFTDCPEYWCYGMVQRVHEVIREDPAAAETMSAEALETVGDRIHLDYYLGYNLLIVRMASLRQAGLRIEAVEFGRESAGRSPWMLTDRGFLRWFYDCTHHIAQLEELLKAAKLFYVMVDMSDRYTEEAVAVVTQALGKARGAAAVQEFLEAQEDETVINPLQDIELPEFPDIDEMLISVGNDPAGQFAAYLATGHLAEALDVALLQLQQAGRSEYRRGKAQENVARCFRAIDLNPIRAQAYLALDGNVATAMVADLKEDIEVAAADVEDDEG